MDARERAGASGTRLWQPPPRLTPAAPGTPEVISRGGMAQIQDFQISPLYKLIYVEPQHIETKKNVVLPSLNRQNKACSSFPSRGSPKMSMFQAPELVNMFP